MLLQKKMARKKGVVDFKQEKKKKMNKRKSKKKKKNPCRNAQAETFNKN